MSLPTLPSPSSYSHRSPTLSYKTLIVVSLESTTNGPTSLMVITTAFSVAGSKSRRPNKICAVYGSLTTFNYSIKMPLEYGKMQSEMPRELVLEYASMQ